VVDGEIAGVGCYAMLKNTPLSRGEPYSHPVSSVPPNKKLETIYCGDHTYRYDIDYWYDEDDQLHYEMKKRWKA